MSDPALTHAAPATPGFRMIRTLGLIAMLSGLVVVLVFHWTQPIIAENQRIATEKAVFQVIQGAEKRRDFLLGPAGATPAEEGGDGEKVYAAYDADGRLRGVAMPAAAQGYQDMIRLLFGYDPYCECIRGIKVLKMTETPGLGDKIIKDPEFQKNFEALDAALTGDRAALKNDIVTVKHGTKQHPWEIDAISGATISANAVGKALDQSAGVLAPLVQKYLKAFEEAGQ